jgi:hypothetical protein
MPIGIFRAWFIFAAIALTASWLALPSVAQAQPFSATAEVPTHSGMHAHAGMHGHAGALVHHVQSMTSTGRDLADCGDGLASNRDNPCCGASMFSCCAPCSLLPAEAETVLEDRAPILVAGNSETADGIPPARLKRPPRLTL